MKWAEPIYNLIGAKVPFYDLMPDTVQGTVKMLNKTYKWNTWADVLDPMPGTEVWAKYSNQFYAGRAAVINRKLGKGTVTFVGPDTHDGSLEKDVLKMVYREAGIPVADLPKGVIIEWRDGFWVGVNYSPKAYQVPIPATAKVLIGSRTLNTADVVVWKD